VVKTNLNQPVYHALVLAHRIDKNGQAFDLTDGSGVYQLELSEGLWAITIQHQPDSNPLRWIYPDQPKLVHYEHDKSNEAKVLNFRVLTADSTITGQVQLPDGSTPPFTVTVALHHNDGIGADTTIDAGGVFTLYVPHGSYKVGVKPDDPNWAGPASPPIEAPPSSTLDLGLLTLIPRDSTITGSITISGTGTPIDGVPVLGWLEHAPGGALGQSGLDGVYALSVYAGTWLVQPAPKPDQPYLYVGQPQEIAVAGSNNLIPNVDFGLVAADATIHGTLIDDNGNLVGDATGWAAAGQIGQPEIHNGAPARNGSFDVLVPGGAAYKVALLLSPGAPYLVSGVSQNVYVGASDTVYVTYTLKAINSHIVGTLWDPRAEVVPSGVNGSVTTWMQDLWARTSINPFNGTYSLGLTGGVWWLDYNVDPDSHYVELKATRAIPVPNGGTMPVVLPVTTRDATLTGTVLAPNGTPMTHTLIVADGFGPELDRLHLTANVDEHGMFTLQVPHGAWTLRATDRHDPRWINPASRPVFVGPNGTVGGLVLQFQQADALITGTLSLQNGAPLTGPVSVWAWADHDQYNQAEALLINGSGVYTLPVISNTLWHVGAAFDTRNTYFITETRVAVIGSHATQDLVLSGPKPKPGPLAIAFDASEPQYLELADGTRIYIPAGALPVSGQVSLHITPIGALPHQHHANLFGYGYTFEAFDADGNPIEDHFNQDVLIVFPYDRAQLIAQGVNERWLKPAYFSTTTDSWTIPDSYVVDTVNNVVAMQIDHFTDFALTSSSGYEVFLPLVMR
jgi:hypothetical protein